MELKGSHRSCEFRGPENMFSNLHLPIGLDLACRLQVRGGNLDAGRSTKSHPPVPGPTIGAHTLQCSPDWGRWVAFAVTPERATGMASGVRREGRANTTCRRREWNPFPFKG